MKRERLIPVLPKSYRSIVLHAISIAEDPIVLMDGQHETDFSEGGPLTQRGIRSCVKFEVRDGSRAILGFHDHPNEMWVVEAFRTVAEYCAQRGWLKIEGEASQATRQGRWP